MNSARPRLAALLHQLQPVRPSARAMSNSPAPPVPPRQLADGGETNHGLPLSPSRQQLLTDVQDLFCSRVTVENLKKNWTRGAYFEDPICCAMGVAEYSAQWMAMPKFFSAVPEAYIVITNEPGLLEFESRINYTVKALGTHKIMRSIVHIELDGEDKITKFEDRWNGKPMPTGTIALALRRLNARTVPKMVSVPKELLV